jgi:hypothetical protein
MIAFLPTCLLNRNIAATTRNCVSNVSHVHQIKVKNWEYVFAIRISKVFTCRTKRLNNMYNTNTVWGKEDGKKESP